jgi:hypothetical protein
LIDRNAGFRTTELLGKSDEWEKAKASLCEAFPFSIRSRYQV